MVTSISTRLRAGIATNSAEETRALASEWVATLPANSTVALHGDLGSGKTTWVQGMAVGLGVTEPVTSPTFTIYNVHRGAGAQLVHLDAYRLTAEAEAEDLLLEEFLVSPWCLAIEWPEKIPAWIPKGTFHLELEVAANGRHRVLLR